VSKRIGLEPRGLARIFGEDASAAAGQDGNIAIPTAALEEVSVADNQPGLPPAPQAANEAGALVGHVAGDAASQVAGQVASEAPVRPGAQPAGFAAANQAGRTDGLQAGLEAASRAGHTEVQRAILQAIPAAAEQEASVAGAGEFAEVVRTVYKTDADKPLTFRFARDENEWLETVCFEITRTTGVKMHKQDLVRLGLNVILADYKRRGDQSYAVQLSRRLGRTDV
jgi:hypothetical protein